jgi:tryptophan synthase alpha chain
MIPANKFPAIVPFVTCGWPTPETFLATVEGLAQVGCPFFEVGFPFSDPIADGPTIQATSAEALENGIDLDTCFELTARATQKAGIPAVAMTYANLVFYPGLDEFCRRLKASGGEGLIVPDLSFEESGPVKEACQKQGIELVSFLAPTTASARRAEVAKVAQGFLYLVAVRGVTGGVSATGPELQQLIEDAKEHATCPVLVGFGVKEPQQVSDILRAGADGAIVGSALLEAVRRAGADPQAVNQAVRDFLGPLVEATSPATQGG